MKKLLTFIFTFLLIVSAYSGTVEPDTVYSTGSSVTAANLNANIAVPINELNGNLNNENADTSNGFRFVETVGSLPSAGTEGRVVFLTTDDTLYFDDGSSWNSVVTPIDTPSANDAIFYDGSNYRLGVLPTTAIGIGVSDYSNSTSSSSSIDLEDLEICYGIIEDLAGNTTQAITNLPFTNSTSYKVTFIIANTASGDDMTVPRLTYDSGAQCTIGSNPAETDALDYNWIAIGS